MLKFSHKADVVTACKGIAINLEILKAAYLRTKYSSINVR